MAGEVVEDHDVAGLERWGELGFDPGLEDLAAHRPIDEPGRGQAVAALAGDEGQTDDLAQRRYKCGIASEIDVARSP